ncbi:MAG: acyltransferase [Chitinophagaceae bacterium]|nr:MAG: acyltransferase [Chitinophagaceae bacterium]
MSGEKVYFRNLDAVRFIAAMMVFMGHAVSPSYKYLPIEGTFAGKVLWTISTGGTGVSVFFVLSGFLITYLLIKEQEASGRISLRNFYVRRVLRIWPLYYLVVGFSMIVYPFLKKMIGMESPTGTNLAYYLTFLSNFDVINVRKYCFGSDAMSQNITWSVSVEEQFYLFWPLLFVLLPRRFWLHGILGLIAGSILFRLLNTNDVQVLYFHTLSVLLDLGIGGLTAYFATKYVRVGRFFRDSSTRLHLILLVVAFTLLLSKDSLFSFAYGNAIGRIFISVSFALIIAAQALTTRESPLNLRKLKFASEWGKYTYGIYLLHPLAIQLTDVALRIVHFPRNSFITLFLVAMVNLVLTLVISKLSFRYFESPFLRYKEKFATIRSREQPVPKAAVSSGFASGPVQPRE